MGYYIALLIPLTSTPGLLVCQPCHLSCQINPRPSSISALPAQQSTAKHSKQSAAQHRKAQQAKASKRSKQAQQASKHSKQAQQASKHSTQASTASKHRKQASTASKHEQQASTASKQAGTASKQASKHQAVGTPERESIGGQYN